MKRTQSVKLPPATIKKLIASGQIPADAVKPPKASKRPLHKDELLESTPQKITFIVGVETSSEANARAWKLKSLRNTAARKSVCHFMGRHAELFAPFAKHWHSGGSLRLTFTRLGGRALDVMANLGTALKGSEDAVALWLGADDGDQERWHATAAQENDWKTVGVMIKIEKIT